MALRICTIDGSAITPALWRSGERMSVCLFGCDVDGGRSPRALLGRARRHRSLDHMARAWPTLGRRTPGLSGLPRRPCARRARPLVGMVPVDARRLHQRHTLATMDRREDDCAPAPQASSGFFPVTVVCRCAFFDALASNAPAPCSSLLYLIPLFFYLSLTRDKQQWICLPSLSEEFF